MNPVIMHKNYFDRARNAIEAGYFLEAVFLEYAAIEGRLEVLCGLYSCPCNKELPDGLRKDINISQRAKCLKAIYQKHPACLKYNTKLSQSFWKDLLGWLKRRNTYVHGLYKRPEEYDKRNEEAYLLAERGYEYARLLYNEVKRVRRLQRAHMGEIKYEGPVCKGKCSFLNK